MRHIVFFLACVVPFVSPLAAQRRSKEDAPEPGSKVTETLKGNYDQKLVIDHRKYEGPGEVATDRNDEDIEFTYPEEVQLVPKVPINPQSPKYTLVPVKVLPTASTTTTTIDMKSNNDDNDEEDNEDDDDEITFPPTIPSDFQQEIENIKIPHVGLPGFITDPPPLEEKMEEDNEDEDEGENGDTDVLNNDKYFTNDFLEPLEFKNDVLPSPAPPVDVSDLDQYRNIKVIIKNRDVYPNKPVIMKTTFPFIDNNNQDESEFRQFHPSLYQDHQIGQMGHSPYCIHRAHMPMRHYGPPRSVVPLKTYRSSYRPYRPPNQQVRGRIYVRYPRNNRPYYRSRAAPRYNMVKVMTQNFVQHPRQYYRNLNPVMMSSGEFRVTEPGKKKKKKKSKKSKGGCKPKRIIQEIHYHHYDPQLSAQLAPLEGINFKEGEDYEHNVKVITKETEIEDDVKKGHKDYTEHNANLEKEMDNYKAETEQRLLHPEYYADSYNPHYSDSGSGSKEYIDYNIQTDSHSKIRDPHPSHDFPQFDRSFKSLEKRIGLVNNSTSVPSPLNSGRFVKHKIVKYYYKTPDKI